MKNKSVILLLFLAICGFSATKAMAGGGDSKTSKFVYQGAGNPYLPLWEHLPDGEPRVLKILIIPGNIVLISLDHTTFVLIVIAVRT